MAQRVLEPPQMPEFQLRQELRDRFPEFSSSTLKKVMKLHNYDFNKCIEALEEKLYSTPPYCTPYSNNYGASTNIVSGRNCNSCGGSAGDGASGVSRGGSNSCIPPPRYTEVPVKHETKHISTVQHTVSPPALPPKPLLPKAAPSDASQFAHPTMPPVQTRPLLLIDIANQGDNAHPAPVRSNDFTPFMNSMPRADIPSIRCGTTSSSTVVSGSGSNASSGSPETRRPVRVINYTNNNSGGTVISGMASPTNLSSKPQFTVYRGDGGGMLSMMPSSSAPCTPVVASRQPVFQHHLVQQETEQPGVHSSSVYINPSMNVRSALNFPDASGQDLSNLPYRAGGVSGLDSQGSVPLHPHAVISHAPDASGMSDWVQPSVPYSGFSYNPSGYGSGLNAPTVSSSRAGLGGDRIVMNVASSGRYGPPDGTSNVPFVQYPVGFVTQGVGQLTVAPMGSPASTSSPLPSAVGSGSSPMLPKTPRLQHQRSTGSSTSRSDSLDSEHSVSSHLTSDFSTPTPSSSYYSSTPQTSSQRVVGGVQMVGVGIISRSSSQSSISSESSSAATPRDPRDPSSDRPRSGSFQEEAAYSQALLHHQRLRKQTLIEDMEIKRQLLNRLRTEVSESEKTKIAQNSQKRIAMNSQKRSTPFGFPTADDIGRLCESNRRLQTDIQMYLNEIDMYKNGQTPFNVIDPMGQQNFFNNMPTGPNDLFVKQGKSQQNTPPPPIPRRPQFPPIRTQPIIQRVNSDDLSTPVPAPQPIQTSGGGSADSEEGERWSCLACTFENHPALKKCEMCEMPRVTGS